MKILQKEYDPVIGANVITRYEKPLYYLDFNNVNESKLDETNRYLKPYNQIKKESVADFLGSQSFSLESTINVNVFNDVSGYAMSLRFLF